MARTAHRSRHYVSPVTLKLLAPLFGYDYTRDAYILRLGGSRFGPALKQDRRRTRQPHNGGERRGSTARRRATPML
jgi:hypothetical protein